MFHNLHAHILLHVTGFIGNTQIFAQYTVTYLKK